MRKVLVTDISNYNVLIEPTEEELKELADAFDPTDGGKHVNVNDDDFGDEELPVPQVCNLAECESCS